MAPEQFMGSYGPEVDIWGAGAVIYAAACGVPPFWASSRSDVQQAVLEKEVKFRHPKWATISDACKDLILRMLHKDPAKRATPLSILGTLTVCAKWFIEFLFCGFLCEVLLVRCLRRG